MSIVRYQPRLFDPQRVDVYHGAALAGYYEIEPGERFLTAQRVRGYLERPVRGSCSLGPAAGIDAESRVRAWFEERLA